MKKNLIALLMICSSVTFAQTFTQTVKVDKANKVTIQTTMSSNTTTEMQGNKMENNTKVISSSSMEVIDISKEKISLKTTLNKIKLDFEGFGQKMNYDSEDKTTHDNMIGKTMKETIGKSDELAVTAEGKLIKEEKKEKEDKKKGGGMQKMMMGGSSFDGSSAFLIIPAGTKVGDSWKKDINEDGLHTQTIYTLESVDANMATIGTKERSKGTVKGEAQGMEMNTEIDNMSSGSITVDITTGLVKKLINKTEVKSKMNMMGQEMPSSGTISATTIYN
jgi:hypothetical protein